MRINCSKFMTAIGVLAVMLFLGKSLNAQGVPQFLNVQGVLYDNDGNPVNGTYSLTFSFYDVETGGTPLVTPYTVQVTVKDGVFHTNIPINGDLFKYYPQMYLGIKVDTDPEMTPRQKIVTVAYAFQAQHADEATVAKDLSCSKPGGCVEDNELVETYAYGDSQHRALSAIDLECPGCVDESDIGDGQVTETKVNFKYAASSTKGGPAIDVACDTSPCINKNEVDFNYAGSTSKGGPASDLECLDPNGCVGTVDLENASVTKDKVNFYFAGSNSKGGPANDVECVGCVSSDDVGFVWAKGVTKGGAAADLSCPGCVGTGDVADGAITKDKVNFNYAGSTSKGGAASNLECQGGPCVSASEVDFNWAKGTAPGGAALDVECTGCVEDQALAETYAFGDSQHRAIDLECQTPGCVGTSDIGSGAVTDEKIGGVISAQHLPIASKTARGTVIVGDYISVDSAGKISVDVANLENVLKSGVPVGQNLIQWEEKVKYWKQIGGPQGSVELNGDNPPEGSTVFRFNGGNGAWVYDRDLIPVDPTKVYYGRIWARKISGTGCFYAGYQAFDKDLNPLAGNGGTYGYFIVSCGSPAATGTYFEGIVHGEGTGVNQFPAGTRYIKPLIIVNYVSGGTGDGLTDVDSFAIYEMAKASDIVCESCVQGNEIEDGTIHTADLADQAVTSAKIKDGTITAQDIAQGGVTTVEIADGTIVNNDISSNANISPTKIAGEALTKSTVFQGDVAGVWNNLQIQPSTVTSTELADNAVTTTKIKDNAVTSAKIADNQVTSSDIKDGTIQTVDLNSNVYAGSGGNYGISDKLARADHRHDDLYAPINHNHDDRYVNLTGDIMTGTLYIDYQNEVNTSSNALEVGCRGNKCWQAGNPNGIIGFPGFGVKHGEIAWYPEAGAFGFINSSSKLPSGDYGALSDVSFVDIYGKNLYAKGFVESSGDVSAHAGVNACVDGGVGCGITIAGVGGFYNKGDGSINFQSVGSLNIRNATDTGFQTIQTGTIEANGNINMHGNIVNDVSKIDFIDNPGGGSGDNAYIQYYREGTSGENTQLLIATTNDADDDIMIKASGPVSLDSTMAGYTQSLVEFRAPKMVDLNDSNYYIDPNLTSHLKTVQIDNIVIDEIGIDVLHLGPQGQPGGGQIQIRSSDNILKVCGPNDSCATASNIVAGKLQLSADGSFANAMACDPGMGGICAVKLVDRLNTSYFVQPSSVSQLNEVRAKKIYDLDDTAYYMDMASQSKINNLYVTGKVGVGTATPNAKLEVVGGNLNIPANQLTFNAGTNTGTAGIASTDSGMIYGEHDSGTETSRLVIDIADNPDDEIVLRTSATSGGSKVDMMRVKYNVLGLAPTTGNVGVGTMTPETKVEIKTSGWKGNDVGSDALRVTATGSIGAALTLKNASGQYWSIYNGGTSSWVGDKNLGFVSHYGANDQSRVKMMITKEGTVGIGTVSPDTSKKLDVAGDVKIRGNTYHNDGKVLDAYIPLGKHGVGGYNAIGYHNDFLIAADKKWSVTVTPACQVGSIEDMFDGKGNSSCGYTSDPGNVVVEIDFGGPTHYLHAISTYFPYSRSRQGIKVEVYHDPDSSNGWSCSDAGMKWTTIAEETAFTGSDFFKRSPVANGICKMRFTFSGNFNMSEFRIGELIAYRQAHYGDEGLYFTKTGTGGNTIYSNVVIGTTEHPKDLTVTGWIYGKFSGDNMECVGCIGSEELEDGGVKSIDIENLTIQGGTGGDIALHTITNDNMADNSIKSNNIVDGTITGDDIKDYSIPHSKLATPAADGVLNNGHFAAIDLVCDGCVQDTDLDMSSLDSRYVNVTGDAMTGNLVLGNSARLGVGVVNPTEAVDVAGNIKASGNISIGGNITIPHDHSIGAGTGTAVKMWGIRGQAGSNQRLELYDRVSIGYPSGWNKFPEPPQHGLYVYGGAILAGNQGDVKVGNIGSLTPMKLTVGGDINATGICINNVCQHDWESVTSHWKLVGNNIYNLNSGNVGIGTQTPETKLHVQTTASADPLAKFGSPNPGDYESIMVYNGSGNLSLAVAGGAANFTPAAQKGDAIIRYKQGGRLLFGNSAQTHITIAGNGNIGIATSSPAYKLDVAGSTRFKESVRFENYNHRFITSDENHGLQFYIAGNYDTNNLWGTRIFKKDCYPGACNGIPLVIETQHGSTWYKTAFFSHGQDPNHPSLRTYYSTYLSTDGGNVGVGTTSPAGRLHIKGGTKSSQAEGIIISKDKSGNYGIEITNAGSGTPYIDFSNDTSVDFDARFRLVGDDALALEGANLGIGTTNPTEALTVSGNIKATGKIDGTQLCINGNCKSDWGTVGRWSVSGNNLYPNDLNWKVGIGTSSPSVKLEVNGDMLARNVRNYYITRTLPNTVNGYVEIGKFHLMHSGHALDISVTVSNSGFSVSKRYIIPLSFAINSGWQVALPISTTGAYSGNDFALDVRQVDSEQTVYLRLRRTKGATSGVAIIHITQRGSKDDAFTELNGTGTTSAPGSYLKTTSLVQAGSKVGIGTESPVSKLDIVGYNASSPGIRVVTTDTSDTNYGIRIEGPAGTERAIGFFTNNNLEWWFGRDNTGDVASGIGFWRSGIGFPFVIRDNGNVGINNTNPQQKLSVAGGWIEPAAGYGLNWKDNAWGGGGDDAYIKYYSQGGENTQLRIQIENDADDDLYMRASGTVTLDSSQYVYVKNNRLSIGTTDHSESLTINGNIYFTPSGSNNHRAIILSNSEWNEGKAPLFSIGYDNGETGEPGIGLDMYTKITSWVRKGIGSTSPESTHYLMIGRGGIGVYTDAGFRAAGNGIFGGRVGIGGVTSPSASLEMNVTSGYEIQFDGTSGANIYAPNSNMYLLTGSGRSIHFGTNGVDSRVVIDAGGKVGIATTTPAYTLDVNGDINASGKICINGDCKSGWSSLVSYWSASGNNIYNNNSGNVGIGTSSPASKLDVNGVIYTNGLRSDGTVDFYGNLNMHNSNINQVNNLVINDPGTYEGIQWAGTSAQWVIDVSPENRTNADGNLNFYGKSNSIVAWRPFKARMDAYLATESGKVGIGTTSPTEKLDVRGNVYINAGSNQGLVKIVGGWAGGYRSWMNKGVLIGSTSDNAYFGLKDEGNNNEDTVIAWGDDDGDDLRFIFARSGGPTNGEEYMRILGSNGNIGVGTASPGYKLDVNGTLRAASSSYFATSSGKVGIGTTNPWGKLEVLGTFDIPGSGVPGSYAPGTTNKLGGSAGYPAVSRGILLTNSTDWLYLGTRTYATDQTEGVIAFGDDGNSGLDFEYWPWNGSGTNAPVSVMKLTPQGRVGIGTTAPSEKLHVVGNALFTGQMKANEVCIGSSCKTEWPVSAADYWTLSGNELYPKTTAINLSVGKTGASGAKLDVNGKIRISNGNYLILSNALTGSEDWGIKADGEHFSIREPEDSNKEYFRIEDDNNIYIKPNGTTAMTLAKSGNVGIGTTSPGYKLEVNGNAKILNYFVFNHTNEFNTVNGNMYIQYRRESDGSTANAGNTIINANSGRVGIGTTSPSEKLDVGGTIAVNGQAALYADSVAIRMGDLKSGDGMRDLYLRAGDHDVIVAKSNGNIGIGTNSPAKKLTVNVSSVSDGILISGGQDGGNIEWRTGTPYHWNIDQYGSTYDLRFFVENSSDTSGVVKMILKGDSGNVGIGTTSPNKKLTVNGDIYASGKIITSQTAYVNSLCFGAEGSTDCISTSSGVTGYWHLQGSKLYPKQTSYNVGIGTSNPQHKLHVYTSDASGTGSVVFRGQNSSNDFTVDVAGGQGLANLVGGAVINSSGSGYNFLSSRGASRISLHDGRINFYTSNSETGSPGANAAGLEYDNAKMTLNNQGYLGIGIGTGTPLERLHVNGNITLGYGNGVHNSIYRVGGVFFTWDSDSYGTNTHHSIRSTYGDSYTDSITLNSFNNIRFNLDTNNNNGTSYFEVGQHTTGTGNILFRIVSPSGNVGIGTTSPSDKLHVNGSGRFDVGSNQRIVFNNSWGSVPTIYVYSNDTAGPNGKPQLRLHGNGPGGKHQIGLRMDGPLTVDEGSTAYFTGNVWMATNSGKKVGIGTTSPVQRLDVRGRIVATDKINDGMLVNLHFDEGNGSSVTDDSGYGHNGSFSGSPVWVSGIFGSAVKCDSSNDYININVDIGNVWSISSWFQYPLIYTGGGWHTLTRGAGGDHQILVNYGSKHLGTYDNAGGTGFHDCGYNMNNLKSGWHHIVAVGKGGYTYFYIDGQYVCKSNFQSKTDIKSVCNYFGGSQTWGVVDEFRVYNRELSSDEIHALWAKGALRSNNGKTYLTSSFVGINTNNPQYNLDVNGNVRVTQKIIANQICWDNGSNCYDTMPGSGDISGSGSAGRLAKFTGTKTIGNSTIYDNGNIGIGTTSPNRKLTIYRGGSAYLNIKDGTHEILMGVDSSGGIVSTMTNHDLQLRAGGNSTKMIIKANGNVGVGTTSPSGRFEVYDTSGTGVKFGLSGTNGKNFKIKEVGDADISFGSYPGAWTPALLIQNNNNSNMVWISPLDGSHYARFRTGGTGLDFYTGGSVNNGGTFAMRITTQGYVGIGTTSPASKLEVAGGWIVPAGGYGLNWRDNIWGGSGDDAWIRYYSEGGENTKLQIGINNDGEDDIELYQAGSWRLKVENGEVKIHHMLRVNTANTTGGGIWISDDGGFYDYNDGWIRFVGSHGIDMSGKTIKNVNIDGSTKYVGFFDDRAIRPSDYPKQRMAYGFTSWNNNNTSPYADFLIMRGWADSSGGKDNLITFSRSTIAARFWQQSFGSTSNFSTYEEFTFTGHGGSTNYVPIYKDYNTIGNSIMHQTGSYMEIDGGLQLNDSNTRIVEGGGNSVRIQTNYGYIDVGAQNSSWAHFYTNRPRYYFNTGITVDTGNIGSYNENLNLQTSGTTRMIIRNDNGNVGIGVNPGKKLDVAGEVRFMQNSNPLYFTSYWHGYPDSATKVSEISNDTGSYKQLMVIGNKSAGGARRVGIWDQLQIAGAPFYQAFNVNGNQYLSGRLGIGVSSTDSSKIRLQVQGNNVGGTNVITDSNDRPTIQIEGKYPNLIIKSQGNQNHSSTIGLWAFDGSNTKQWNMGVGQNGYFSIGYCTNNANPHCGLNNYSTTSAVVILPNRNVGIGKNNPSHKLDVAGAVNATQLCLNGSCKSSWDSVGGVSGSGTTNRLAKWTSSNKLGSSTIFDNGNIGIGTTSPQAKLDVRGHIKAIGVTNNYILAGSNSISNILFDGSGSHRPAVIVRGHYPHLELISQVSNYTHGPTIRFMGYDNGSSGNWKHFVIGTPARNTTYLDIGYSYSGKCSNSNPHCGIANYNGTTIMRLQSNGRVGIGTTSPQAKLDVSGKIRVSKGNYLILSNAASGSEDWGIKADGEHFSIREPEDGNKEYFRIEDDNNIYIKPNGSTSMTLLKNGNVGIGTTSPGYKLDVNGTGKFSKRLYLKEWLQYDQNTGIYWSNTKWHIYPYNSNDLYIRGGANGSALKFTINDTTPRGYLHWNTSNELGFLDTGRGWQWLTKTASGYAGNIWFNDGNWSGNPGTDWGKIEYHSDRFYIASGSNSAEIVRFRRYNSDKGIIYNDGSAYFYGYVKAGNRNFYFGSNQRLYGDNGAYLQWYPNHSTVTGMVFYDKEGKRYGYVYGDGNGANFGLLDGDGNWSYLAAKDNYTEFRINNSTKVRINSNGNVGIGTTSPHYKLQVNGAMHDSYSGETGTYTKNAGWYRIAQCSGGGKRCYARFIIKETRSSYHQAVEFIAGFHYGNNPIINVLGNSWHGNGGAFRYIRIVKKGTYDPAYLEVYIDANSTTGVKAWMYDNIQNDGWTLLNWTGGGVPSGYSTVTLDLNKGTGFLTNARIYTSNSVWASNICDENGNNCLDLSSNGGAVGGSGSTNYIPKWSNGSTLKNSQIYDNGSNVGIGTSSPNYKLRVEGDIYLTNWLRFHDNDGVYWKNTGWHIYPYDSYRLKLRSGHSSTAYLMLRRNNDGALGGLYANTSNIGLVNPSEGWQVYSYHGGGNSYKGNLYFPEGSWSGDPGSNVGKIQYHSDRFYIVSGSNSAEIVRFRRGSSDKGIIYNDGSAYFYGYVRSGSYVKANNRYFYLGNYQYLYGDNSSALYYRSYHNTVTQMIFQDWQGTQYGRVYGDGNGANFGLLDGDGNWSYLAAKDNYTEFRINNSTKMRINSNGNVGIGTTSPYEKLHVQGNITLGYGNGVHNSIYRVGGVYFTWDSDSYGTNSYHSIRSTNGNTWTDAITINSYGNVRLNIDTNNNGSNTFTIGHQTTGTGNTLFTFDEGGNFKLHAGWIIPHPGHGINWPDNAWGGSGDDAWIKYYSEGGENTKLQIGINNDGNDDLEFYQNGAWRLRIENGEIATNGKFCAKKEFKTNNADIWSDSQCDCNWAELKNYVNPGSMRGLSCPKGKFIAALQFGPDDDPDTNEYVIRAYCCRPCEFSTH